MNYRRNCADWVLPFLAVAISRCDVSPGRPQRAAPALETSWSAEKLPRIDVPGESARRHAAKIVNAPRVRTVIKPGSSRPARKRISARRRWPIARGLILLDRCANQRARCRARSCAQSRPPHMTGCCAANDGPGCSAPACPLANWRFTGSQNQRADHKNPPSKKIVHSHIFHPRQAD
jgi:hypothetical protein